MRLYLHMCAMVCIAGSNELLKSNWNIFKIIFCLKIKRNILNLNQLSEPTWYFCGYTKQLKNTDIFCDKKASGTMVV